MTIGTDHSDVVDGVVQRTTPPCGGGNMVLSTQLADKSAAMAFRQLPQDAAKKQAQPQITLYGRSPVIELNRAAAVAMARGPSEGLRLLDELEKRAELRGYYLLPAARGDMARRLERWSAAAEAYRQAISLVTNEAERRFLARRLAEADSKSR